ncbi:MAG TPA: hypothetical protein V6D30_11755 [Leptolyngbyaceae cyanobacterium]
MSASPPATSIVPDIRKRSRPQLWGSEVRSALLVPKAIALHKLILKFVLSSLHA